MDFKMKIKIDPKTQEHYLVFLDEDDIKKKSRFLKSMVKLNKFAVTMTIQEETDMFTKSQWGMYEAFVFLIKEYTGYSISEVKSDIASNMGITENDIKNYSTKEFSEFIERLFLMCSENIGIVVQQGPDGKLKIVKND
jgi:predicted transcriptional regulator